MNDFSLQEQLHETVQKGDTLELNALIQGGVDVNARLQRFEGDRFSFPLLHMAASKGHTKMCELLIKTHGAKVHIRDEEFGATPLCMAVKYGQLETCKLLIDNGADVNTADIIESTPLHRSAADGNAEICQLLIDNGANVNIRDMVNFTPLDLSRHKGHTEVCDILTKSGGTTSTSAAT